MIDPITHLRQEHVRFARLLDMLEMQLERLHGDEEPFYELMLDIMYYMTHLPDLVHHPREDLAFARVAERDPKARGVVDELRKEHGQLKESGEMLVKDLEGIVNGAIVTRDHVEAPGRNYIKSFRHHMNREETELFPWVSRILGQADWTAIDTVIQRREDPLQDPNAGQRYEALRQHIAREASSYLA